MNLQFRILCFFLFIISSCVEVARPFDKIPPGIWRAELQITDDVALPFNLESSYDENNKLEIYIVNAEERIEVQEISFGRTKQLKDTLIMKFPLMDSYIEVEYKENVMQGKWYVNYRGDYDIPFVAFHGQGHRFTTDKVTPITDVTGRWEASFEIETETPYPAIGDFKQKGSYLTGTFMTETGDYRYLQGTIQGDQFMLSCFDGGHSFLFTANISKSEVLSGKFYNGKHYQTNWVAGRNSEATIRDPYQLSQITTPDKKINFTLKNTDGEEVKLTDSKYQGKAKLICIMGTWCPNCLDESKFLVDFKQKNPELELEIIALAFEKYRDEDKALSILKNYKDRLNIPYEMLHAGYYDKAEATKNLGFIDEIISYPTLLFVDRSNTVQKVHTGFAGPATSEWSNFVAEFKSSIEELLK